MYGNFLHLVLEAENSLRGIGETGDRDGEGGILSIPWEQGLTGIQQKDLYMELEA